MLLACSRLSPCLIALCLWGTIGLSETGAQSITPANDGTSTRVSSEGNRIDIGGGKLSQDGANLFHSFEQFGLSSEQIANFLAHPNIQNILGRVVGGDASVINGLIQVTGGNSNLFLINPAGIVFGSNASLNVPADFTATTANRIQIGNNWFNALGNNNYAALVGTPNGFAFTTSQLGSIFNAGNLAVGKGHLNLIGGTVINTGTLSAPGGNITIAAVPGEKLVRISQAGSLLSLDLPVKTEKVNGQAKPLAALSLPELLTGGNLPSAIDVVTNPDGTVQLTGNSGYVLNQGQLSTTSSTGGGQIDVTAGVVENRGQIQANGSSGGSVRIETTNLLDAGQISTNGTKGDGGTIQVNYSGRAIQTASAHTSANGDRGGAIEFNGDADTVLTTSGKLKATGETGGSVRLFGQDLRLLAANVDASGNKGGGEILVGGDYQGQTQGAANAQKTFVNPASSLKADALVAGNGGRVIVWSDALTKFYGNVTARGGKLSGNGGLMEVSGKNELVFSGEADASAAKGEAGQLLLDPKNITIDNSARGISFQLFDPNPAASNEFGYNTAVLTNGNIVVSSPGDDLIAPNAGAVYLFNPDTGALLGTINGSHNNDSSGGYRITDLSNGNYVLANPYANINGKAVAGTAILANGNTGTEIGRISGSKNYDYFGEDGIIALSNGNYVLGNSDADVNGKAGAGTAILASGTTGKEISRISGSNKLDYFGKNNRNNAITALSNGNYVLANPFADIGGKGDAGTVVLANGTTGKEIGRISGSNNGDLFGEDGVTALSNSNYVFGNSNADIDGKAQAGTVILANGTTGKEISRISGRKDFEFFGQSEITALSNGNYVFGNPSADIGGKGDAGTVILANGNTGVEIGRISGSNNDDNFGNGGIIALSNGNYVLGNPYANINGKTETGTVVLGNGTTGKEIGRISGSNNYDRLGTSWIKVLSNGNYVLGNPFAAVDGKATAGTAILANGTTGKEIGRISGSNKGDLFGGFEGEITALSNGNYVLGNPVADVDGKTDAGSVILVNGTTGKEISRISGNNRDFFGRAITALSNGNYVAANPYTTVNGKTNAGTVILANGTTGKEIGRISGSNNGDFFGGYRITSLSNSNYVFSNPEANIDGKTGTGTVIYNAGTVVLANGTTGAEISRISGSKNDERFGGRITALSNGNYFFGNLSANSYAGRVDIGIANPSSLTYSSFPARDITINPALITQATNTGTAVTLQANNDITLNSAITTNNPTGNGGNLTFQAGRSILLNANISTDNGNLTLSANDPAAIKAQRAPGAGVIKLAPGTRLKTGTGNLKIALGTGTKSSGGITLTLNQSVTNADAGKITLQLLNPFRDLGIDTITGQFNFNLSSTSISNLTKGFNQLQLDALTELATSDLVISASSTYLPFLSQLHTSQN